MEDQPLKRGRYPLTRHQTAALVIVVLAIVFILENRRTATVRFLIPQVSAPLWLALFVAGLLGFAAGALAVAPGRNRRSS